MTDKRFFKKTQESFSLDELATHIGAKLDKRNGIENISDIAPLDKAQPAELCFLSNPKYVNQLATTKASICILSTKDAPSAPDNLSLLIVNNPYLAYAKIAELFYGKQVNEPTVSKQAIIADSAKIGNNCHIEAGVVIGENAQIGDNNIIKAGAVIDENVIIGNDCCIGNNATISYAIIGNKVYFNAGCVIGQGGFGFATDKSGHHKILQLGLVIIEDNVEIGSNTTIDRGSSSNTIIGFGTKIDNLVHIAHNVIIGKHCFIVGQVGISGSTEIGDYVVCGGQVGISGHLKIGSYNRFAAQAGVTKSLEAGNNDYYGMPAIKKKEWQMEKIALRKLAKELKN
jgi:UDP-3-O-[3-hydroxymyristoyl] glucosamine N-acyltransferase